VSEIIGHAKIICSFAQASEKNSRLQTVRQLDNLWIMYILMLS